MKVSIIKKQEIYFFDDWTISEPSGLRHVDQLPLQFVTPGVVLADPHPSAGPGRRVLVGDQDGDTRLITVDRLIARHAHDTSGLDIKEFTLRCGEKHPHNGSHVFIMHCNHLLRLFPDPSRSDSDAHSDVLKRDMIVEVQPRSAGSGTMVGTLLL
jgi:hypothetical protein